MSALNNSFNLPQGFSVYQPILGAQLQFFPAIGTPELDDLINSFIPGPISMPEKRATIALDFFEYVQLTGENFKFYPVFSVTPMDSPATASPLQDSSCGSFNASPVMSNWDWSQVSVAASQTSKTSNPSHQRRSSPKASSSISRHQTTDFSHLPGMKIMTKDGRDVTNSASRGSKTKEQRDHAHLMRIIKACDSCRRKKVRCDPSHKKRGASQAQPQSTAKTAKKMKAVTQEAKAAEKPVIVEQHQFTESMTSFVADPSFAAPSLEGLDPTLAFADSWEDFVHYPTETIPEDYDFFRDPEGHLFAPSSSSLSASPSSLPSSSSLLGVPNAPSAGLSPILNTDQSSDLSPDRSLDCTPDLSLDLSPDLSPYRDPGLDGLEDTVLDLGYHRALDTSSDASLDVEEAQIDYNEYVGINHNRLDHRGGNDRYDLVNVDDKAYAQIEYPDSDYVRNPSVLASDGGNEPYVSDATAQNSTVALEGNNAHGSENIIEHIDVPRIDHNGIASVDSYQPTEGYYNASSSDDVGLACYLEGEESLQQVSTMRKSRRATTCTTTTRTMAVRMTANRTTKRTTTADCLSLKMQTMGAFALSIASVTNHTATWPSTILSLSLLFIVFQSCLQLFFGFQFQGAMWTTQSRTKQLSTHPDALSRPSGTLRALRRQLGVSRNQLALHGCLTHNA